MTGLAAAGALLSLVVVGATAGPRLLAAASAGFSARPRLGMAVWLLAAALWTTALLALGPLLAWLVTGPTLPGALGATCRRCLAATNPFGGSPLPTDIPVSAFLAVPVALTATLAVRAGLRWARSRNLTRAHLRGLSATARQATLDELTPVWVLPAAEPLAYSVPGGRAGVVVSQGALDALRPDELTAVLAHERAHLAQRHHVALALLADLRSILGRVPLISAAGPAVAAYAEMAADDAARRASSTRALAGALLTLAAAPVPVGAHVVAHPTALHAAALEPTSRARRLVDPAGTASPWGLVLVGAYLSAVLAGVALVAIPYGSALVAATC